MQSGCRADADLGVGQPVGRERRGGHLGRRALHTACVVKRRGLAARRRARNTEPEPEPDPYARGPRRRVIAECRRPSLLAGMKEGPRPHRIMVQAPARLQCVRRAALVQTAGGLCQDSNSAIDWLVPPLGASRVSSTAARPAARTRSLRRCFSDSALSLRNRQGDYCGDGSARWQWRLVAALTGQPQARPPRHRSSAG